MMQGAQAIPAEAPLDLLQGFAITDQNAHRLAVQRITGLQRPDAERLCGCYLAHQSHLATKQYSAIDGSGDETPIWGESRRQKRRTRTGAMLCDAIVTPAVEKFGPSIQLS